MQLMVDALYYLTHITFSILIVYDQVNLEIYINLYIRLWSGLK